LKAPIAKGGKEGEGQETEEMKRQPRHLIFLLKSNRLAWPGEVGGGVGGGWVRREFLCL
jgi:hypothetical protein